MTIELTLLGTGGPRPDVKRFQSATLVVVNGERYLVDCGDGTSGQLLKAGVDPGGVSTLLLTHLHVDHCFGVAPFIYAGWFHGREQLRVFGPGATRELIDVQVNSVYARDIQLRLSYGRSVAGLKDVAVTEIKPGLVLESDTCRITALGVLHDAPSETYALRFEDGAGRSLVISSDTGYCEALATFAQGTDILVHECYLTGGGQFANDRPGHAERLAQIHVTPEQAGAIGRLAGTKRLVLTHLPVNVDDSAVAERAGRTYGGPAIVGCDLMHFVV
ncbi:MAG: MBL fold metallo-hydrolase [Betaproteobacteria bacterium]|nr:MBL fold metallo-hydrolase [Betaproteobacteria bacterium]